jgi:hypothetical protein
MASAFSHQIPTMIAYQDGIAKFFGIDAADHKDDDEYEVAHWFKVNSLDWQDLFN